MLSKLIAALVVCTLVVPLPGFATDWFVGPAGNDGNGCLSAGDACLTLQGAINKAAATDTIQVAAGTYPVTGVVNVNKQLTLLGAQAGIDARGRTAAESILQNSGGLAVGASGVVVDGFTIEDSTATSTGFGVSLGIGTSGTQVLNNIIQDNIVGMWLANTGASEAVIRRNWIRNNNVAGPASGHGIYTDQFVAGATLSNVLIVENLFEDHVGQALGFSSTNPAQPSTNITISENVSDGNGRFMYAFNLTNSIVRDNDVVNSTDAATADLRLFEGVSNVAFSGNRIASGAGRALRISNIGTGAPNTTGISLTYNSIDANGPVGIVQIDAGSYTGTLVGTCNHWGNASGPTTAANPGGTGESLADPSSQVTFLPWLVNGVDGAASVGYQPQSPYPVGDTPGGSESAADNDYRRLSNAIGCAVDDQTIALSGTFDWTEANAAASWALGSDNVGTTSDDYSIGVRPNLNGVTLTAAALGAATINGPGDLAAVNLEGVLDFGGGDNQNWTISNLGFAGFDLAIGMFSGAGGTDAYDGTTITNNTFAVPADLNASVAPADVNQNIAIHFSFGRNQTISNNEIRFAGNGVANSGGGQSASSIGMQSNVSGGSIYDGLLIDGNALRVLNAQSPDPETILGIWENGHAHTSDITISNNDFVNMAAGNDPAQNRQRAFRVTSHSSLTTTVLFQDNTIGGANIGFEWLNGANFAGNEPVQLRSNEIADAGTGVLLRSNGVATITMNGITGGATGVDLASGVATLSCNSVTGNTTGIRSAIATATAFDNAIVGNGTGIDGSGIPVGPAMSAENNWWDCAAGPGNPGCDSVTGNVDVTPVLGALPGCVSCTTDAECDDGLVCNGDETCNTGMCEGEMPPACGLGLADPQCNTAGCVEPAGCVVNRATDGTTCAFAPSDTCSIPDTCQGGICAAGGGGDRDGDGVCNADDNCPDAPSAGHEDLDNDGEGDVCDARDAALNLTKVRIRRAKRPDKPRSSISAQGDFLTEPADGLNVTGGVALRVRDALGLDVSATIAGVDCLTQKNGRIRCKRPDRTARAFFRPIAGAAGAYRFDVRITKLLITPPLQAPVEVTIRQSADAIDRAGEITSCAASAKALACEEP